MDEAKNEVLGSKSNRCVNKNLIRERETHNQVQIEKENVYILVIHVWID